LSGHLIHWTQATRSAGMAHVGGTLEAVENGVITVAFDNRIAQYRNHAAETLLEVAALGDEVTVCEAYSILRFAISHFQRRCFSIISADEPWTPCSYQPRFPATPEGLAQRLNTRGGFSVPGHQLTGGSDA
jgi:hypothetical protein